VTHQHDTDGPLKETAAEVRQGPMGRPVAWVLGASLVLAALAFMYFMSTDIENPPPSLGVTNGQTPSTDAVPNNTEPQRLDAPSPSNPQQ